jgi:PAS domain S-box-containing protein
MRLKPAPPAGPGSNQASAGAAKVVAAYALFAGLWILLSDKVVELFVPDRATVILVSLLKGWLFVAITSLLLFVLVTRFGRRLAAREQDLQRQREERAQAEQAFQRNEETLQALAVGAHDALLESERRFATAFQFVPVGLGITRLQDSVMLSVNEAFLKIFGYVREEVEGVRFQATAFWPDPEVRAAHLKELQQGGKVVNREAVAQKKDGTRIQVVFSAEIVTMQGVPSLLFAVVDVTARRQTEEEHRRLAEEVQHAQKLDSLGSLASGVAHDMNNVLAAIQAVAELLGDRLASDPQAAAGLATITKATGRGRDLVKGLTNFARKGLREAEPVDLNQIVREEAALLDRTLLQKVKLIIDLATPLPLLWGEASALGSALMNLCVNAVDAMPKGGTLALRTRALEDGGIELKVEDTGEGMTAEVAKRATEPFFTTKPAGQGTGLGLAMVHGIVKAHGGTLTIQSAMLAGTTIQLQFPALPRGSAGRMADAVPKAAPGRALHVLLVDDDDLIRASIPAILASFGHEAVTAEGGREALDLLERGLPVDLVILDLNMPEMSGVETLGPLRGLRPEVPVLVASGFLDAATAEVLGAYPQLRTLSKPFSMADLDARIRELCP